MRSRKEMVMSRAACQRLTEYLICSWMNVRVASIDCEKMKLKFAEAPETILPRALKESHTVLRIEVSRLAKTAPMMLS